MSDIERGKFVKVTWEDPTSAATWMSAADVAEFHRSGTYLAHSVGWIVAEDDEAISIAATITVTDEYVGQIFRIPKHCISEIEHVSFRSVSKTVTDVEPPSVD